MVTTGEVAELLREDNREKRMARGGVAIGKVRPQTLRLPCDMVPAWWKVCPAIVHVVVATGEVRVFSWPLVEMAVVTSGGGR